MTYIIIGFAGLLFLAWLGKVCFDRYDSRAWLLISAIAGGSALIAAFVIVFAGYEWKASARKALIVNAEFRTHYSTEDIFYAEDVIETIQQIKRQRVEVNGDILKRNEAGK